MPRKSTKRKVQHPDPLSRFNEAGAVMPRKRPIFRLVSKRFFSASMRPGLLCPGKGGGCWAIASARPSFNEAGAVMPRKRGRGRRAGREGPHASMRPGLLCPGKGAKRATPLTGPAGFNEAGAVMPRKSIPEHWYGGGGDVLQ